MATIFYGLADPISRIESEMVSLSQVALTLWINNRQQSPLIFTYNEARDFCLAISTNEPLIGNMNGNRVWLASYNKPQLIDGQGNIISRKDVV